MAFDFLFGDRVNILYSGHQSLPAGTRLRVFFFGSFATDRNVPVPLGFADGIFDENGNFSGTLQLLVSNPDIVTLTNYAVTDVTGASCTGEPAVATPISGPPLVAQNTTGNHDSTIKSNEPVDTFTGELFDLETVDLNLRGPMPLFFARYYASMVASDGNITGALGRNRLHNFDAKLTVAGTNATAVLNNGRVVQFTRPGKAWVLGGRTDIAFQLVASGANFILADPRSQRMWTFDSTGRLTKIEDGRGNAHTLAYDADNRLTSVNDGLGRTLTLAYDGSSHIAAVSDGTRNVAFTYAGSDLATATDPLNQTTTFSYDGGGHLLSTQPPRGNSPFSQTYDASSRVATQTEHPAIGDQLATFAYNTSTRVTTLTDPAGKTRVTTHTATGEATAFTDEESKTVALGSDATGRRNSITDRLGRTTLIAYHGPSGKPASVTAPDGTTTTLEYKPRVVAGITFFDPVKITRADGTMQTFTHDGNGNVLTAVDPLGMTSTFTYNARGQILTATDPAGGVATFTYDAATGNPASSRDSDTGVTTYTYDTFSRVTRVTHPDATHIDIVYDAADRITSTTDERGKTSAFAYDNNGNVITITDPANATTQFAYDALDRVIRITDRLGKVNSRTFDSRDLIESGTDALGHTTLAHDARRRVVNVTEPGAEATTFGYDDEGWLTSVTDPLAHTATLLRNTHGRVIAVTDALGHRTEFHRDAMQRITKIVDPPGRQNTVTWDNRGLLAGAARDGAGRSSYQRDAAGHLTRIIDPNKSAWDYSYTAAGRLKTGTDPLGRPTGFAYDARGQLASLVLPEGGACTLERDSAGNTTRLVFTGGPDLQFGYDALGRVSSANGVALTRDAEGRITNSLQDGINFSAAYDNAGRLTSVGYNNGALVVTYTYDVNDRLTHVSDNLSGATVDFIYDAAGRLTSLTRSNGVNMMLTYDAANRLTRLQDGSFLDLHYTLDAAGDITAADFTAPLVPTVAADAKQFQYDAASQVKSGGFTYDARGRLIAAPGHTFMWDSASRLIALDSTALTYDGFGDVTTRTSGGATTRLFYHHAIGLHPLVAERNEADQFTRFYVWTPGGTLLYAIDAAAHAPCFYHYDRVGSTLALTNTAGAVTDAYAYTPLGEPLGHTGTSAQPFTFAGAFGIRAEGPLYQMRARYYDPITSRFLSRDPRRPSLADPRTLDPYLYALGNPLRYVDVTGAAPKNENEMGIGGALAKSPALTLAVMLIVNKLEGDDEMSAFAATATKISLMPPAPLIDTDVAQPILPPAGVVILPSDFGARTTAREEQRRHANYLTFDDAIVGVHEAAPGNLVPADTSQAVASPGDDCNHAGANLLAGVFSTFGVEKTFFVGTTSIGLRLPFLQSHGGLPGAQAPDMGDLALITKYALINDRPGSVLSGGLNVAIPTLVRGPSPAPALGPRPFASEGPIVLRFRF